MEGTFFVKFVLFFFRILEAVVGIIISIIALVTPNCPTKVFEGAFIWFLFVTLYTLIGTAIMRTKGELQLVNKGQSHIAQILEQAHQYTLAKPEVITHCKVTRPFCSLKPREVILRKTKKFEFKHWIDLTDKILLEKYAFRGFVKIDFDIAFDDEETEQSYKKHVQNLLDELPEFCRNGDITTKRIFKLKDQDVTNKQVNFHNEPLSFQYWRFPHVNIMLKFGIWCAEKMFAKFFANRIVIKKLISNKNIEVIV